MSTKPHVEIAAVIPDDQGRIVIGKKKGTHRPKRTTFDEEEDV